MATKKYLSLERLTEYDALIKQEISDSVSSKADKSHSHDDRYYTETEVDGLISSVNTSIDNITSGSTPVKEAEHATNADSATSSLDAEKLGGQLPSYYAKASDIPTGALADKDVVSESDLDSALAEKVNAASEGNHSHLNKTVLDGITAEKVSAWDSAEENARTYTDGKVANLASTDVVDNKISAHNTSTVAHSDIRDLVTDLTTKVNNFLDVDDTTTDQLSEVLELIENNKGTLESLTSNKVNVSDIVDNLTTANAQKVLSANQGVALKALIDDLQTSVNGKAAQTSLDAHTGDTTVHITSDERTKWNAAKTHADSDHAPSNAQANVIENIKVNGKALTPYGKAVDITVPTDNSQLANGAGYLVASDIANKADKATTLSGYGITNAYTKTEVDAKTSVDDALSSTSTKPVQNKVVNTAIVTATSAISANTSSIAGHTSRIESLETKIGDGFEEITSAEIAALFE